MEKIEKLTAVNLKQTLWETLNKVKSGDLNASEADSIATQAREIIRTTNTQLRISQMANRPLSIDVLNFSENA